MDIFKTTKSDPDSMEIIKKEGLLCFDVCHSMVLSTKIATACFQMFRAISGTNENGAGC